MRQRPARAHATRGVRWKLQALALAATGTAWMPKAAGQPHGDLASYESVSGSLSGQRHLVTVMGRTGTDNGGVVSTAKAIDDGGAIARQVWLTHLAHIDAAVTLSQAEDRL
jgi:hypothetical protein